MVQPDRKLKYRLSRTPENVVSIIISYKFLILHNLVTLLGRIFERFRGEPYGIYRELY